MITTSIPIKIIDRIELAEDYVKGLVSVTKRPVIKTRNKYKVVFKNGQERYCDNIIKYENEPNRIEIVEY